MIPGTEEPLTYRGASLERFPDPTLEPVYRLAQRCRYEPTHAHHVTHLSLRIFDELVDLHGLGGKKRFWLLCAGLLHDIGWVDGGAAHHKASLRYILQSELLPWDHRQRHVVGSVARYHRRALPKDSHDHFAALAPRDKKDVRLLAACLRVGDALDRTHRGIVRHVECAVSNQRIQIHCTSHLPAQTEAKKAVEKADLMTLIFDRKVEVAWRLL